MSPISSPTVSRIPQIQNLRHWNREKCLNQMLSMQQLLEKRIKFQDFLKKNLYLNRMECIVVVFKDAELQMAQRWNSRNIWKHLQRTFTIIYKPLETSAENVHYHLQTSGNICRERPWSASDPDVWLNIYSLIFFTCSSCSRFRLHISVLVQRKFSPDFSFFFASFEQSTVDQTKTKPGLNQVSGKFEMRPSCCMSKTHFGDFFLNWF